MGIILALQIIKDTGDSDARFGRPFDEACSELARHRDLMTSRELAEALEWLDKFDCYYVSGCCELKDAMLKEAAKRLRPT